MNPPDSSADRPRPTPPAPTPDSAASAGGGEPRPAGGTALSPDSGDNAWLESALHATAREHVDDAGFTGRVLAALPPAAAPTRVGWFRRYRRTWLLGAAALAGSALALAFAPAEFPVRSAGGTEELLALLERSFAAAPWLADAFVNAVAAACLAVSGWWTWRRV